jgi:NAD(P)H-dependent FMN reductase
MADPQIGIMTIVGSMRQRSITRAVLLDLGERLRARGCGVDLLDLSTEPLPLYNPDTAGQQPGFDSLRARVERADVYVLGTPDYHGSISGLMKNFLDHFWHEFAGKLFVPLVASHEKGLTTIDQIRTVARQCYAWALPYGVSFVEETDVRDGHVVNRKLADRLAMLERDTHVYGALLAGQRRRDLDGVGPGFMARHRKGRSA